MLNTTRPNASTHSAPSFEFFEGNLSVSSSRAQITVRKGGLMVLSRAAVEMLLEDVGGELSHVQLAYDPNTGAVGVRACNAETPGRYTLRSQKTNPGRLVGGKRFFKHHGLTIDSAESYAAERFDDGIVGFYLCKNETAENETPKPETPKPEAETKKPTARRKNKSAA